MSETEHRQRESRRGALGLAIAGLIALSIAATPTAAHHTPNGQGDHPQSNGQGDDKHPGTSGEPPPPPPPPPPPGEEPPSGEEPPADPGTGGEDPENPVFESSQAEGGGSGASAPTEVPEGATSIDGAALPVAGESEVVDRVRGTVRYRLPGSNRFVDLPDARNLPNGTVVDARFGIAEVFVSDGNGGFDSILAWAGLFVMTNRVPGDVGPTGSRTLTEFRLVGRLGSCRTRSAGPRSRTSARRRSRTRRLWTRTGRGRFRTRGRFASATVRGTRWLTLDGCDARGPRTTILVDEGSVTVRNHLSGATRPVPAGSHLTVRP